MNAARLLMLATAASTTIGCASARDRLIGPKPTAKAPSPNVEAVARRYNANSSKLQSIRCESVTIDGKAKDPKDPNAKSQIYTLDAMLAFEKPSNFRLKGMLIGRPEVDLGSNKDEIWCWVKRADPGAVYFCKRDDLGKMQMAIPFQPDWLAEVLGVTEINPAEYEWRGEKKERNSYSIMSYQTTPAGERVIKLMIFDSRTDRLGAIRLFSATDNRLLADAFIEEYYQDSKTGLHVPRVVRLAWPDAGTEMTVKLGRRSIELNAISADDGVALFTRGLNEKQPINMADPRLHDMQEPTPVNQRTRSGYATPEPARNRRAKSQDDGIVDLGAPRAIGVRKASGDDSE